MMTVRNFQRTDEDYKQAIDIHNQVWCDYPNTPVEWQSRDNRRSEQEKWARFVGELDGVPVALATYEQPLDLYHPRKFWIGLNVLPAHRRKGMGTALFEHLLAELDAHQPLAIFTDTREDFTDGMKFVQKVGFEEVMREYESRLDPGAVDLEEWRRYEERVADQGIVIRSVAELATDPHRDHKLYEMVWSIHQDVPEPTQHTKVPFEEWQKIWQRPNLLPQGWFVALDRDQYVGMSELSCSQARSDMLYTGLTGVIRDYRRRGIALALKLCAIRFAQQRGVTRISTWNEEHNTGMLSINERLGFVRQPAFVQFVKKLRDE